ncbi:MAG: right-handed parallel beta-helix repeat-containing protein, partial [Methanobrevibacter sp.]|nr:right-handed parallel beta-helix repeat-containing protein [Methanobrevibacter sp.]
MNFKRVILISLILCFLSVACVSASETQTSMESSDFNDLNAIDVADDDINEYDNGMYDVTGKRGSDGQVAVLENVLSSSNVDDKNATLDVADNGMGAGGNASDGQNCVSGDVLSSSNSDDMLSASNEGTRNDLNNLILVARPGSTITLDRDYKFYDGVNPITITKDIVIDGKGHSIYLNHYMAFKLDNKNPTGKIQIKNITFLCGTYGAISGSNCCQVIISNCRFINNSGDFSGPISLMTKYDSQIINCTFKRCFATGSSKVTKWETIAQIDSTGFSAGGAISISGPVTVKSCRFEECSAGDGGAITAYGNCKIIDSVFVKNYAGRADAPQSYDNGGAIRLNYGSGALIKGCTFTENYARFGGAISSMANNVRIEDCVFNSNYMNNKLRQEGGAIFVSYDSHIGDTSIVITRCAFNNNGYNNNNHYCKYGGAIYFHDGIASGTVSYCNFTGNGASKEGGAVYASSNCKSLTFTGCLFTKNKVDKYGGAIYLDSKSSNIVDCAFIEQPNAIYCDNKGCNVRFCTFLRNDNYDVWSTKEINIEKNWFGNTMDTRSYDFSKLKGKAVNLKNYENLYLVATFMDKNYYNGLESTVILNFRYMRDAPTSDNNLPPFNNPAISYGVTGQNAIVVSKNLYLANGKSSFKFVADATMGSSSLTVDCYGAKITLKFKTNPYSFNALQVLVDNCQNGVLNLDHGYARDKSIDGDMTVSISKNLVINGNGFTVDSKNLGGVFNIAKSVNVEINNLNIVNCYSNFGAAIEGYANRIVVNNCGFINCSAKSDGGAIKLIGKRITITNSTFINNTAGGKGGSLWLSGISTVKDCIFINSNAGYYGSFIFLDVHTRLDLSNSILLTYSTTKYIDKPSGPESQVNVTVNIENNWFGGTNDDILRNYEMLNNFAVKSLIYLNVMPSVYDIPVGNSSNISLKFYAYDLNSRRSVPLTSFRNMKFGVKLLNEGGTLSSDSIILINNEGSVVYTSSSDGEIPIEIDYELFAHRIYLNQFDDGSFTDLKYLISNSGDVINLTSDYTFSLMSDYMLTDGIYINKDLTINGNGHVIDGDGQARIFNIDGHKVVLNNITFINGKADNGGAICTSTQTSLYIDSCRFENNSARNGGAIYLESYKDVNIDASVFNSNSAEKEGGAIYYSGDYRRKIFSNITGNFTNNRAEDGGAIYLIDVGQYRLKGNFISNSARNMGGAVYSHGAIGIPFFFIDGIFDSNSAAFGGAVYSFSPFGNFNGIYQNNRASKDGGAIYMLGSSSKYGRPSNISGEFYSNTAGDQGSAVCALNIGDKNVDVYDSIFMKNNGKSTIYSSGKYYLDVRNSIFVDNVNINVLDASQEEVVGGLRAYNNWFGNTVDNLDKGPSVGRRVILNDWLFLDVDYGKTETYMGSLNSITFTLKSYDAKKGTVSEYTGDFKLNLSLKSDNGDFSTDSFILHDIPFEVTFVPEEYGESKVVVLANLSKYSHKVYEIKYNVVDHPSDSFYVLQYEIDNMNGTVLNLSGNYEFYPEIDALDGIKINKSITINGNGFVIDGKGESRIFNILADDVVLENISLINGNDINGSAIYATGRNITIRNSVLLNNFDVVIYATNPLNANYNWWGNTADTFNGKANVSSNVILDNALFATFNANSTIISAGKNTTLTLNLTNLYNFNLETNSTYGGLNLFAFIFNADGGNINVTSDDLHDGMIYVSFEAMGPYYGEIFAIFESVVLKHEFEVIYDEDSLTALYYLINKTGSGGVVNLTHDYKFYYYDVDYISGIPIDKTVTINGNGFDIDAMNESSIFVVSADNVSLTNINIYNSFNAVEWLGNNGVISNVSVNNSYCALNCFGSNVVVRNSNFTRANRYSVYLEGSNHVVDNCRFVDNSGLSIIGLEVNNLTIENSLFENIYSPISGIIEIDGCNGVNITGCIFNNQNNKSISIVGGSTVYLNKNNLSISDYIFNDGTILSKTFACLDDVNSSYMVGDVILLNATIYDDNNNIILLDEFYFKIDDELYLADFYIDAYEYLWVLTNGSWLVLPEISEKSFENCTVDSLIVNVLKYNSSVVITSIADVVYGEDVNIGFKFENSTAVRITVTLNSEMVFNETTDEHDISIPDLKAGLYNVIIRTLETEYYQSSSVTSAFRVTRAGSSLTLMDVVDAYYGKDIIINFTVENRTNVIASIYDIDTREFVFNDAVEGDFLIISNLSVGSYSITLTNIIDQNYNPSGDYAVFNVLKVNSSIIFDNKTEYVYGNVLINYVVDNLTEVMVTVVDLESGERDNFTTTNSTISLDLDAGFYQVELVNVETENVFASQDFKTLFVIPANSSVEIDGIGDVYYGDDIEISFVVMNATNVTVVVKNEDGAVIYQNNTDESYVDLSDLAVGKYAVEVYNSGSINFNPSSDTKTFYVLKASSLIEFDYSNVIYYGLPFRLDYDVENETVLNICIYDFEGNIIYDKNFNEIPELPEEVTNLTEDAYLGFYFFIYRNLTVGNYTFEFTNLGNSNISGDRVNGSFEIIKAPSYIEVLVDSIYCGDDLEVQIAVVNATVVNVMIEDDVDGGIVYNENVSESLVIVSNLPAGRYTVIVTNYGTENVIGNSSSQEFNVFRFNSTVTLNNISDIYYEDAVLIGFDVENKTVVNVMIQNQDGEVIYDENVTSDMLSVSYLDVGNYTVTVTNMETFNVSRSSDSKSFKVLKRSINITVVVEDNVYGELSVIHVISDIDGLLPVNVGNQQLFVGVVDGHGKVMISLDAGNYTAYVNYTDDNYDINMTNSSFVVTRANITLNIIVLDKVYTADVDGNVFASVDGEYKVIIGNYAVPVIVKDGIGSFNAGILTTGNYSASVIFKGTNNYNSADNETSFKVTQSGTNFNVVVNGTNITYGDVINVTQSLPADAAGNITYRFANGTIIDVIGVNGSFVLFGLDAGSYVVYAEYSGDSNYASAMDSLTIVVNKAVNDVLVYVSDVVYGENATIIVRADVDGRYTIGVGGRKVIVDVVDGIGVADIALDAGSYSTAVEFVDANYDNNVSDCEFAVSKADISLSIEVLDKVYTADVAGNVFASVDGEYMVVIGSYAVYVVVEDGVGSFNVGILNVGDYTAFVIFNGESNYNSADNVTAFKVTPSGTNFNVIANATEISYGGVINVTQSLPADAAGNITYRFANGTIIDVIGVNGSFVLSGLDAGSYVVYAEYSGDSNYAFAKDSLTIVVNKAVNNVVVYACDVVYGENTTITVSADVDG